MVTTAAPARVVVAAPGSGQGKTTVATGLMAALRAAGHRVSGHKVGPDYIDPGFHELATGRAPRNLDPFLQGDDRLLPLLRSGAEQADIAVIEGVMGLFDGALGTDGYASTAHVARELAAPVLLVVDASAASRSVAALVHGFAHYDPGIRLAGVLLNKLGSQRHEDEIRAALEPTGVPVLGALRRDEQIHAPSRDLGVVPAAERAEVVNTTIPRLQQWVSQGVDLQAVARVAQQAPEQLGPVWRAEEQLEPCGGRPTVALAAGQAFTFRYTETAELLAAAGVEVVDIDPLEDTGLPDDCAGLYLGGGFPESYAGELASNGPMLRATARAVRTGMPVVAECAGLLYLCRELDDVAMAGVLNATATMAGGGRLGYRRARAVTSNVVAELGQEVTGHEFHRSTVTPGADSASAWRWNDTTEGVTTPNVHASQLHVHWAGHPELAQRFAGSAQRYQEVQYGR